MLVVRAVSGLAGVLLLIVCLFSPFRGATLAAAVAVLAVSLARRRLPTVRQSVIISAIGAFVGAFFLEHDQPASFVLGYALGISGFHALTAWFLTVAARSDRQPEPQTE